GKLESFNLFIPRFMGGSSSEAFPKDSKTVESLMRMGASSQEANQVLSQIPMYWGDQTFVGAPAYIGAIVIFLSVLALFLIRGRLKWWIISAFILTLLLSWGKNFSGLTEFFIDFVPFYDKFRAVSSIQVIIELILPILAIVGLHKFFSKFENEDEKKKALLYSTGIVGGLTLIFILFKSTLFDFASPYDSYFRDEMGLPFVEAIREDRMSLFTSDAIRSLIFVVLTAGVLWFFMKGKLKKGFAIAALSILMIIDLVGVDRRYVDEEAFVQAKLMDEPFQKNAADEQILKDEGHFRVY